MNITLYLVLVLIPWIIASPSPTSTPTPKSTSKYRRFDMFALTDFQDASHRLQLTPTRQLLIDSNYSKPEDNFALSIASLEDIDDDKQSEFAILSMNPKTNQFIVNIIKLTQTSEIHLLSSNNFPNPYNLSYYSFMNRSSIHAVNNFNFHQQQHQHSNRYIHYHDHCSLSLALIGHRNIRNKKSQLRKITTIAIGTPCYSLTGNVFIYSINSDGKPTQLKNNRTKDLNYFLNNNRNVNDVLKIPLNSYFIPLPLNYDETLSPKARFGSAVAHVGDINGDNIPDIIIGAPGESSIYTVFLNTDYVRPKSIIKAYTEYGTFKGFGSAIAPIGDVNNDGIMDLIISSSQTIHLVYLSNLGKVNRSIPIKLSPNVVNSGNGVSLSFVGLDDNERIVFAVGDQYDNDGGIRKGALWIVHIDALGNVWNCIKFSSTQGNLDGVLENGDHFAASVATALDDGNKDGTAELLVGIPKPSLLSLSPLSESRSYHYNHINSDLPKKPRPGSLWILDIPGTKSVKLTKMKEISPLNECIYTSTSCTCSFTHRRNSICLTFAEDTSSYQLLCHERYCSSSFECDCRGTDVCSIQYISKTVLRRVTDVEDQLLSPRKGEEMLVRCMEANMNVTALSLIT